MKKTVKAWAVLEGKYLPAWGTPVANAAPPAQNVWQFPLHPTKTEAQDFLRRRGISDGRVVRATITYDLT